MANMTQIESRPTKRDRVTQRNGYEVRQQNGHAFLSSKMRSEFETFAQANEANNSNDLSHKYNDLAEKLRVYNIEVAHRHVFNRYDVRDDAADDAPFRHAPSSNIGVFVLVVALILAIMTLTAYARSTKAMGTLPYAATEYEKVGQGNAKPSHQGVEVSLKSNLGESRVAADSSPDESYDIRNDAKYPHNTLRRFVDSACHECRWFVGLVVVVVVIRRLLLSDPWTKIIASGVYGAAIALHHSIALAHRFVVELKRLAERLKNVVPAAPTQTAGLSSEIWRTFQGVAWLFAIALSVLITADLISVEKHLPLLVLNVPIPLTTSTPVTDSPLKIVSEMIGEVVVEWKHVIVALALAAWLKRFLLQQTYAQIVGCGIECLAIVIDHTILLARHAVAGLRHIADELRTHTP